MEERVKEISDIKCGLDAYLLGRKYYDGLNGYEKDYDKAQEVYFLGLKYSDAFYCYYGIGVLFNGRDEKKANEYFDLFIKSIKELTEEEIIEPTLQLCIGCCFDFGLGVSQDHKKAVEWYTKAAEQGFAHAQCNLGYCYECHQDYKNAVEWYIKSAKQGNARAQGNLGICYYYGLGVSKDYNKAIEWYMKAAEQGYEFAMDSLGDCYYNGYGVPQNYKKAEYWHSKKANEGDADAQYELGNRYYEGDGISQNYKKAIEWYTKAAEQGYEFAMDSLGDCYYNGHGVPQDYEKAVEWYTKAAEQGCKSAMDSLGDCYYNGHGVPQNYMKAEYWYSKKANEGDADAQYELGDRFYKGDGLPQDYKEAVKWYRKASKQGFQWAQFELGNCYSKGLGVPQDYNEAVKWYTKAVDQGNEYAMDSLGDCYYKGDGVPQNYAKAVELWTKVANSNSFLSAKAKYNLGVFYEKGNEASQDYSQALEWYKKAVESGLVEVNEDVKRVEKIIQEKKQGKANIHIGKRQDVFISWNHNDKDIKNAIVKYIFNQGIYSCFDSDANGSGYVEEACFNAIDNSSSFFVIVTPNSLKSEWVKKEVSHVLMRLNDKIISERMVKAVYVGVKDEINKLKEEDPQNPFVKLVDFGLMSCYFDKIGETEIKDIYFHIKEMVSYSRIYNYNKKLLDRYSTFESFVASSICFSESFSEGKENNDIIIPTAVNYEKGYLNRSVKKLDGNDGALFDEKDVVMQDVSLIYGEGGCGKSVFIGQIVRNNYHKHNKMFFVTSCNAFYNDIKKGKSLIEHLYEVFWMVLSGSEPLNKDIDMDSFKSIFSKKEDMYVNDVAIVFDAIDELPSSNFFDVIKEKIKTFLNIYSSVKLIFTSREKKDIEKLSFLDIKPTLYHLDRLSEEEVRMLFNNILEGIKTPSNEKTINLISENKDDFFVSLSSIEDDIRHNALLLTNLIIIYIKNKNIPTKKYEILEATKSILINDIEDRRGINFKYQDEILPKLSRILESIAFKQYRGETNELSVFMDALDEAGIKDTEEKAKALIEYLRRRSIVVNNDFYHQFFKEYFASKYCYSELYQNSKNRVKKTIICFAEDNGIPLLIDYTKEYFSEEKWINVTSLLLAKLDYECKTYQYKEIINPTLEIMDSNKVHSSVVENIERMVFYNDEFKEYKFTK